MAKSCKKIDLHQDYQYTITFADANKIADMEEKLMNQFQNFDDALNPQELTQICARKYFGKKERGLGKQFMWVPKTVVENLIFFFEESEKLAVPFTQKRQMVRYKYIDKIKDLVRKKIDVIHEEIGGKIVKKHVKDVLRRIEDIFMIINEYSVGSSICIKKYRLCEFKLAGNIAKGKTELNKIIGENFSVHYVKELLERDISNYFENDKMTISFHKSSSLHCVHRGVFKKRS